MVSKILVIDDDPAVRGAFRLILEEDGFSVREAEDGLKGIEMVNADRPDLIFLDLRMPGIGRYAKLCITAIMTSVLLCTVRYCEPDAAWVRSLYLAHELCIISSILKQLSKS